MINVEEVIKIYIQYKGFRQGLFTDYGSVFDSYLEIFKNELKKCSMFENTDRENSLVIKYIDDKFVIYSTDEKASVWGVKFIYEDEDDAIKKYLELFQFI